MRSWGLGVALCFVARAVDAQGLSPPRAGTPVEGHDIVPRPSGVVPVFPGTGFQLRNPVTIAVPESKRMHEVGALLASELKGLGLATRLTDGQNASIAIDTMLHDGNPEAYQLAVHESGIAIHAASPTGALWAIQTLLQILPPDPTGSIMVESV